MTERLKKLAGRSSVWVMGVAAILLLHCGDAEESRTEVHAPRATEERAVQRTGFAYDDLFLQHDTSAGHPDRPERLRAIVRRLGQKGLLARLERLPARLPATEWITTIHSEGYIARVEQSCRDGVSYLDSPDTPICANSYEVAVGAVGCVLSAVDAVADGRFENAFCAVRPPGHHALKDRAMGFCIFNNIAIAARYIQEKHKLPKVLIVDWDVHHGNGTQEAFYDDPTVLCFGVHRCSFYPGTGSEQEKGTGRGVGYTVNAPLPRGGVDADFVRALEEKLVPAALAFRPDFVLISAGFDAHESDPLGGMRVTSEGFARLTRIVKRIAEEHCEGRIVSVLEGGYDLEGLADAVEAHIRVLME